MKRASNLRDMGRAGAVIAASLMAISGVTFATLQSQPVKLTGNTIETATANLQLSTDGLSFGSELPGFDFNSLVPGGPAMPQTGDAIYLKNTGTAPLGLKLAIANTPSNPQNIDPGLVNFILTTVGSSGTQSFSMQALMAANTIGGLPVSGPGVGSGATQEYKLQVSLDGNAVNASDAAINGLDLIFIGAAQIN